MRAKRAKLLLKCARKYFKNAREARKVIAYYVREAHKARKSTASMRAKRAKVLLVCAQSARKYCYFAREARKELLVFVRSARKYFLYAREARESIAI